MRKLLILSLILVSIPLCIMAEDIVLSRDTRNTGITIVSDRVMDRAEPSMILNCFASKLTAEVVNTEAGNFTLLSIPRFHTSSTIGVPSLPMMNQLVEIPVDAELKVRVISSEEQEYSLKDLGIIYPLMPLQPSHPKDGTKVPFVYERSAYGQDAYQQEDIVSITEVGMLRNIRLAFLKVAPVAYNPVQGKIKVYNNIQIEITMPGSDLKRTAEVLKNYASPYFKWVRRAVLTAPSMRTLGGEVSYAPVTYVIVADRMFETDLKPFIAWKTQKGFNVITAYTDTIGKTTTEIQTYLFNLYNTSKPTFVLFVGDYGQIPSFAGKTGSHVTDLYYATVTSGDNLPDMYTGRFSANSSAELVPQIEKTLEYEKYLMPDPSFLADTVLIAGWDSSHAVEWGWPQINYATKYYYNAEHGYKAVHVNLSAGSHQNESQIIGFVSAGTGYLNYTAHGSSTSWADPSFSISQINSLTNKSKYPLVVGNCCLTNKFEITTCFGEAWLRAKDKGAIGYIGGSNSTYWDEDLWWGNGNYPIVHPNAQGTPPTKDVTGVGAYEGVFEAGYSSNCAMMVVGNLAVQESSSPRKQYYWEVYHLMGDPSLSVYLGVPNPMTVTHESTLTIGNSFVVTAEPSAYVGITQNGVLIGAGMTNEKNDASIVLNAAAEGTAVVVVTKQNRQPYFAEIKLVK